LRHNLTLGGYAFRLRPVWERDTSFILSLRTDPHLNRYIHATRDDPCTHSAWLAAYNGRAGDFYFIIERQNNGEPEGTISLYHLDESSMSAEWGRWLVKSGSLAAVESAWLIYRIAFEQLDLVTVFSRTMAQNEKVISFHESCGCLRRATVRIDGEDFVEHVLARSLWLSVGPELGLRARRIAALLSK